MGEPAAILPAEQPPASPSDPPDTWLDEEISSLVEAVDDHAQPAPARVVRVQAPAPQKRVRGRRRSDAGLGARTVGRVVDIRGIDLAFLVAGVVLAMLIAWVVSR